jgi:hypothetical protein
MDTDDRWIDIAGSGSFPVLNFLAQYSPFQITVPLCHMPVITFPMCD